MLHTAYFYTLIIFCYILPIVIIEPGIYCNERLYEPGRTPVQRPVFTRTARVSTRVCELTWLIWHNETHIWHNQSRLASPSNITPPETKPYKPRILTTSKLAKVKIRCRLTYTSSPLGNCDGGITRSSRGQTKPSSYAEQFHTQQQRQDPTKDRQLHDRRRHCTKVSHSNTIPSYRSLITHRLSGKFGTTDDDNSPQSHANPLVNQPTPMNPGVTPLPQETLDDDECAVYFEGTDIKIAPPDW